MSTRTKVLFAVCLSAAVIACCIASRPRGRSPLEDRIKALASGALFVCNSPEVDGPRFSLGALSFALPRDVSWSAESVRDKWIKLTSPEAVLLFQPPLHHKGVDHLVRYQARHLPEVMTKDEVELRLALNLPNGNQIQDWLEDECSSDAAAEFSYLKKLLSAKPISVQLVRLPSLKGLLTQVDRRGGYSFVFYSNDERTNGGFVMEAKTDAGVSILQRIVCGLSLTPDPQTSGTTEDLLAVVTGIRSAFPTTAPTATSTAQ